MKRYYLILYFLGDNKSPVLETMMTIRWRDMLMYGGLGNRTARKAFILC